MLNQQIIIYAHQYQAPQVVYAVQHDTGRTLTFVPGDFQIPAGATAQLWCKTPSGVLSFAAGTVSGQEITAALTEYNLAEAGNNIGQLQISADGDYIKAFSFILRVQEEVNGEELTPEEMTLLEQAIAEMQAEISDQLAAFEDEMDGLVPKTREINGHALDQDVTLTPGDIGAAASSTEINGHALTGDINLTPGDVGAVPDTLEINNYALDEDIALHAVDIPFTPTQDIEATNVQNAINEAVGLMSEAHEDTLYTNAGTTSPVGDYTLSADVSGYQYLDIYSYFTGLTEIKRVPVSENTSYQLRFMNLADSESSTFLGFSELGVSFSGTTMTVTHNKYENWSGNVDSNPVIASSGKPYIVKVMGVKYDVIGSGGGGGGGSVNWGSIGGTLSNQTDLANALGEKITAPSSAATGAFLVWNGSAWVAQTLSTWQGGNY